MFLLFPYSKSLWPSHQVRDIIVTSGNWSLIWSNWAATACWKAQLQLALATHHAVRAWKKDDNKGGKYKHTDIVLVYIYIWGQSGTHLTNLIYLIFGFVQKYRMPSKWLFNKEKNYDKPNGEMCEIGPEIESSTAEHCGTSIIIQKCNRPRPHFITCHDWENLSKKVEHLQIQSCYSYYTVFVRAKWGHKLLHAVATSCLWPRCCMVTWDCPCPGLLKSVKISGS